MLNQLRSIVPILAFLTLWEFVARAKVFPQVVFPSFLTVLWQLVYLLVQGKLLVDIVTTTFRAVSGLTFAVVMGMTIGLSMVRFKLVNWFFEPVLAIGFPMPKITLIPVFILWFGIGHTSKILLVAFACFFPITLSTVAGARGVDQHLIWSARAMGSTEREIFWHVILPASLPFIISGVRITLPVSLIVAFVAEMIGGGGGLGYTLVYGYRYLETPTVFAVLLTVLTLGFLLDRMLLEGRNRLLLWEDDMPRESVYD
ncbi:MAG: ABC transporter permease [Ardenticatenaceae bacterium]|nr:ABC transporter permease [Ardenticatenaceae bacterium]